MCVSDSRHPGFACARTIGYFGWANEIQIMTPLQMMMSMNFGYKICARIISFLFIIKTLTTFPLTFWPLYREVEALLDLDEVLGVQLQLPWAVRRQRCLKVATRIVLVTLCLLTLLLNGQSSHQLILLFMGIPLNVCHFAFPACVGCLAIRRHWQLQTRLHPEVTRENTVEYMFGSIKIHYWAVHIMAVATWSTWLSHGVFFCGGGAPGLCFCWRDMYLRLVGQQEHMYRYIMSFRYI